MAGPFLDGVRYSRKEPVYGFIVSLALAFFGVLGIRRHVSGAEHIPARGGVIFACTHFSYVDFALLGWQVWASHRRPMRYLATRAAFRHPLIGPLMRGAGHVPVDRGSGSQAYAEAVKTLQAGEVLGIFPEGRVSLSYELLEFKTGAVRLAIESGAPVIPVVVWGSHRISTRGHRTRLREAFRAPVLIDIGAPLHFAAGEDVNEANRRLRAHMVAQMHGLQRSPVLAPRAGAWWVPRRLGGSAPLQG
jgi:1-acyl-sn-glycerol-3-phosphate acyltransferase